MAVQRKLAENSAYRLFTEKLLDYMMQRTGLELPENVYLGHCCLCDDFEWVKSITADKEPMAVTATLKPGRFNLGHILVNTRRLESRKAFTIFSMTMHQLNLLSVNTIHELVHFWYEEHSDSFYEVMSQTGVVIDYETPRNSEGYLQEKGIDDVLMMQAAEFLVDAYNEIELSGMCRFVTLNNLLFKI